MIYAKRMSQYAAELAAKETDPKRKEELLKISEINAKVPAHKPDTFWEAIQAVWTIESLLPVEENQTGMSIGRVDQYMYPYYKADIDSGRMDNFLAFELAGCMLVKMSEMMWITSEGGSKFFAGYQPLDVYKRQLIGSTGMSLDGFDPVMLIGFIAAFVCALGWGIEGAMGGYACSMVDTEVAITIRQVTSGIGNGIVLVSILSLIGGDGIGTGISMVGQALTDMPSIWLFLIGGIFASWSFKYWYKGAAMCGAALGMGCNGTYAFWGPVWCFVICGLVFGVVGYAIPWQGWVGAIVMVIGIFVLAISQQRATAKEA